MTDSEPLNPSHLADDLHIACDALRWTCDPAQLPFETTETVEPLQSIIGQDDAMDALRFGLETFAPGQNVFVRGLTGTGRLTLVKRLLEEIHPACPLAADYCYVANFERPEAPRLLTLLRGQARLFRDSIDGFIDFLRKDLVPALSSDTLRSRRQFLDERFQEEAARITKPFEEELQENGLTLVTLTAGSAVRPALVPVIDGHPAPPERVQNLRASGELSEKDAEGIERKIDAYAKKLAETSAEMQEVSLKHAKAIKAFYRTETEALLSAVTRRIREDFPDEAVGRLLDELIQDVLRHGIEELQKDGAAARRYRVNVILDHGPDDGCPVILESTPTLANLLGSIDRRVLPEGVVVSDHLMISAGSLLRADGGYLVLEAREVLSEPGAWKVLVRTLRAGRLEIVPPELGGPWGNRTLKPEPIPLNVKVVLIGDPGLYHLLDEMDPDFPHLFKVLADFDSSIPRESKGIEAYAGLLARIAGEEGLPHFDRTAVAALAEHGARIAGRNDRLTTRFGRLIDLAREAAFLTTKSTDSFVTGERVRQAVQRTKRRADLPARKFRERVADGTIRIQTTGEAIGEVNGLAVISAGMLRYGFPSRITATIGAGTAGTINIERESQLSGAIHTKGFYILGGLLRHLLRTQHPLAFSASIAFEQSYGGIDGDSASGAEICCLLSALTGIPLRQDLAMTGAIDQHGGILPIGAGTEKIEGFFDTCDDAGLTGTQGVILPKTNVSNLMLRQDVVAACAEGRFHVYAVDHIQEALEIFTGVEAGVPDESNEYPEGTLLRRAVDRAFEFWTLAAAQPVWETEEGEGEEAEEAETSGAAPSGA